MPIRPDGRMTIQNNWWVRGGARGPQASQGCEGQKTLGLNGQKTAKVAGAAKAFPYTNFKHQASSLL